MAVRAALAVLGGLVLSLLAPPANLHWLHWIAFAPMFVAIDADSPRANRWLASLYGTVGVGTLFRWIAQTILLYTELPGPVAYGLLALFAAVFGLPYVAWWVALHPLRRRLGLGWIPAWAALLVVIEWLSMQLLLFPYQQGVSQYRVPSTFQLASVTGVYGLSFLLALTNAVVGEAWYRWREGRPQVAGPAGATAAGVAAVVAWSTWRHSRIEALLAAAPVARIGQVQVKEDMLWRMDHGAREAWDLWVARTTALPREPVDLVIWPEGASPYDLGGGRDSKVARTLGELSKAGDFDFLVGAGRRERGRDPVTGEAFAHAYNTVWFVDRTGTVRDHYDKMVPLPFGEYLPFAWAYPWIATRVPVGEFRAGAGPVWFETAIGRVGTPICYEAILPRTARRFLGADVLVTVTNDAWFGDTANPHQHAMLAAARAVELGVPMVRSAYTGISFVAEPHGHLLHETTPFTDVSRVVTLRNARVDTVYARFGDWFVAACALGLAGALARSRRAGPIAGTSSARGE